jgi:hypothetical protein
MRFHGLMVLRDEGDIIEQSLTHMLGWADTVFILDLGSIDQTWEIVQDYARRDPRVVPYKQVPWIFNDNFRGFLFNQYRNRFDAGDWVLKLDADEFYHVSPRDFVQHHMGLGETAAWLQWYYFRLTTAEVEDYESGRVSQLVDRRRGIEDRRRFYKITEHSEPRMFRYRRAMRWPHDASFPFNAGFVARNRIPIRHYPHRDPLQMQTRFRLRAQMMSLRAHAGGHWKLHDWREEVVDSRGIAAAAMGTKRGLAGENGVDTGELRFWEPGTALPVVSTRPAYQPLQRSLQRIIHPLLLPILDRTRRVFDSTYEPALLPEPVQRALRTETSKQSAL